MGLLKTSNLAGACLALACVPDLATDLWRVDAPRILAVAAEPAEAAPGEVVTLTALHADASGTLAGERLAWSLCTARRPLAELGPVARACLADTSEFIMPVGTGPSMQATIPADACRLFGPEPPPAVDGQPAGRPVDPDLTGGYYQPLRVTPPDDGLALFQLRITCGLAGATQQQAAEFRKRYQANVPPVIAAIARDGVAIGDGEPLVIAPGEPAQLRVSWPTCPEEPSCGDGLCTLGETLESCADDCTDATGCGGAETYLRFDPAALELRAQREAIRVAWYTTAGTFAAASTGRAANDPAATSDNTWTAPEDPGPATIWIVLRDDRGGASWRTLDVEVE